MPFACSREDRFTNVLPEFRYSKLGFLLEDAAITSTLHLFIVHSLIALNIGYSMGKVEYG